MENLIFSLNATAPVFLMMVLGVVFRVPLPMLVFEDLATIDFVGRLSN